MICTPEAHPGAPFAGSETRNSANFHVWGWVCLWGALGAKIFSGRGGTHPPYMCAKYHWSTPHGHRDMPCQKLVTLSMGENTLKNEPLRNPKGNWPTEANFGIACATFF